MAVVCRDTDVPDTRTQKRQLQRAQVLVALGCQLWTPPTGIPAGHPAVSCRGAFRHDTAGGGAKGKSTAQTRRHSGGTGAASAPCGAQSRVRGACRRCGTARRRRCTCSAGLRARHVRGDADGSWWWTRRRIVHTAEPLSNDVAVMDIHTHKDQLTNNSVSVSTTTSMIYIKILSYFQIKSNQIVHLYGAY